MSSAKTETVSEACPVIDAIQQIGSTWRLAILYELQGDEQRFNELERSTGANSRTLARVLDDLQGAALVERRVEAAAPVATYYSLTEKGESLEPVFERVENWAQDWLTACTGPANED